MKPFTLLTRATVLGLVLLGAVACTHAQQVHESEEVRLTAQAAYDSFAKGWATGDFEPYLAMLTEDFEFSYPLGEHRGRFTGAEGRAHMVDKVRAHSSRGERLTLLSPTRVAVTGHTVFFEFDSEGRFGDYEYRGHNVIAFDVTGERISAFREFLGDLDTAFVCTPAPGGG
ncbi:MAG TPA: nuclear transport factor 2 family protein [Archangium sp.]|nr:nuclear transport factor 2 family protein [Archangium sp.]